jgi:ABC-type Fe3+-siderophore transport system permease subunit
VKIAVAVLLSLLALVIAPLLGPALPADAGDFILWQLRVPRVLMGLLVGGTLSIVGASYQAIFTNPLAAPSTVGTTAGATLGALLAIVLGARTAVWGLPLVASAAFAGGLSVSLAVAAFASQNRVRVNDVVLAGIACSLAASAVSTGVQYAADSDTLVAAVRWSLGHLPQVGYHGVLFLLPFALLTLLVLLRLTRALQAMSAGEERAYSQGVNPAAVRTFTIFVGAVGVAACVAWCGPIAFIELIVPHLVRRSLGTAQRIVLPMSFLVGGAFLAVCDALTRVISPARELPAGVLTAAIGAPMLVYLVARRTREG